MAIAVNRRNRVDQLTQEVARSLATKVVLFHGLWQADWASTPPP